MRLFFEAVVCMYVCLRILVFLTVILQNIFKGYSTYIAFIILIPAFAYLVYKIFQQWLSDSQEQQDQQVQQTERPLHLWAPFAFLLGLLFCYESFFGESKLQRETGIAIKVFVSGCTLFLGVMLFYYFMQWYNNRKDSWL